MLSESLDLIFQYDIPAYFPLTRYMPFVIDHAKQFEQNSFDKYKIYPLSLTPPLRNKQEVAAWYNKTYQSWALSYTIAFLDGAELLFSSGSTGSLQVRMTDILGHPISGIPQGQLEPRLNLLMFYRKDVFADNNISVVPQSWDDLLIVLKLLNGEIGE